MSFSSLATTWIAISGGAIAIVTAATTCGTNRRAQYDRVRSRDGGTHRTGDIAKSRHNVGRAFEGKSTEEKRTALDGELYADFFSVLWVFERLYGLFVSLKPIVPRGGRLTRPERLLLLSVRGAASHMG